MRPKPLCMINTELERLAALRRYEILDTPPEGAFNRLVKAAASLYNMPIAIVSLVDEDRIWFKAEFGVGTNQIARAPGLCASAILSDDVYVVENARTDPRTLTNPLVAGQFGLQFYAGAPLITKDGYRLGTFCIIDRKPRYINKSQKEALHDLAAVVVDEMEIRLAARQAIEKSSKQIAELQQDLAVFKGDLRAA